MRIRILHVLNGSIFTATPLGFWTRLPRCIRRNQREALAAYRIRRHRPRISASFSGTCCRKHSHAADIRYCLLADGLERINDSMLTSIPSRNTVFRFSGIPTPFQDVNDCAYHSTRSTCSTRLSSSLFVYFVVNPLCVLCVLLDHRSLGEGGCGYSHDVLLHGQSPLHNLPMPALVRPNATQYPVPL